MAPQLAIAFDPQLAGSLYTAISNTRMVRSQRFQAIHTLRARAAPFGHNALPPGGSPAKPGSEWPLATTGNLKDAVTVELSAWTPGQTIAPAKVQITAEVGGKTYKLKFGHHGGNQPVMDLTTRKVEITAQNHGFAVDADSLKGAAEVTHLNLNDNTVEGLAHRELPLFSVQYHPESSPGPHDANYLFSRFIDLMAGHSK